MSAIYYSIPPTDVPKKATTDYVYISEDYNKHSKQKSPNTSHVTCKPYPTLTPIVINNSIM